MKELDFFTGYHGSGKTYTANSLLDTFNAQLFDGGPMIRQTFIESGLSNFDEWVRQQENDTGKNWDDFLILKNIKSSLRRGVESPEHLFIVGNRSLDTINFLKNELSDGEFDKILFFEKPFHIMKNGYEKRTGREITDNEFLQILQSDEDMGLLKIKKYIESTPETNSIIKSSRYDIDSIDLTGQVILRTKKS